MQIFILDHRTHRASTIVDTALAESQGPALLAYNDTVFKEDDWRALQTIHGSNKGGDEMLASRNFFTYKEADIISLSGKLENSVSECAAVTMFVYSELPLILISCWIDAGHR